MTDEPNTQQDQDADEVESHHWKPSASEDPGRRMAHEDDTDDEVEAHHWKPSASEDPGARM